MSYPEYIVAVRKRTAFNPHINRKMVCGNSDYTIKFDFDDEWSELNVKTARFIYNEKFVDVVFEGDTVNVPVLKNTTSLTVGVFAGNVRTTTPAVFSVMKSITSDDGVPDAPTPDVYSQIIDLIEHSGVKPEVINQLIHDYLEQHPFVESDPTVPAWAKEPNKPEYTAEEIGALPATTVIPPDLTKSVEALQDDVSKKQGIIADLGEIRQGAGLGKTAIQAEIDPTVPSWAKQPTKPTYTASEVHALPDDTVIPPDLTEAVSKKQDIISDLSDIRQGAKLGKTALQSFTETDPTVSAWAKQPNKPEYTAQEVHALPDTTVIPDPYDDTEIRGMVNDKVSTADLADAEMRFDKTAVVKAFRTNEFLVTNIADGEQCPITPTTQNGWGWVKIPVTPGKEYTVTTYGGSNPRAWAFLTDDYILIRKSPGGAVLNSEILTAPADSAWLLINNNFTSMSDGGIISYDDTDVDSIREIRDRIKPPTLCVITEDMVTVTLDDTKGVSPYLTSYGYTNIEVKKDAGIKWSEGSWYTFLVSDALVVQSNFRNVRIRIGGVDDGDVWHPFTSGTTVASGYTYFTKAYSAIWQYKSTVRPEGSLQVATDNNTTYAYLVNQIIGDSTNSMIHIDPNGFGARYSLIFPTTPLSDANGAVTDELWSSLVMSSSTSNKTACGCTFYLDRHPMYILTANINAGDKAINAVYQDYSGYDARYVVNTNSSYMERNSRAYLFLQNFDSVERTFTSSASTGGIVTTGKLSARFSPTLTRDVYLLFLGYTGSNWYQITPAFTQTCKIYKYTPSTGKLVATDIIAG